MTGKRTNGTLKTVELFAGEGGKPSTKKYFWFMNQMSETNDYEEKYKYARMSLACLPFFVKSEIKEYGSFDIRSIPAIDYVKAYLKTHRNKQELEKVYKKLSKINGIESWVDDLSDIMNEIDFLDRLHEFLSDNPGFIQSNLGKTLGIPQRLIGNHLSWAEKFGLIQREKKGLKNKIFLLPDHVNLIEACKSDLKESVTTEPGKIIKNETQKELKKIQPRHISLDKISFSLDKVPYYPLPPSPPIWEAKGGDVIIVFPKKEIFEIAEDSKWEFTENRKLENDEKPETFFKEVRLTASGTLFIDTKGKNEKYQGCKASLLKRGKNGKVTAEAGLSNDIYRIGTSPLNDWYVFMSSEGMLHGYNETLEKVFEHDLSEDPRIKEHYESSIPTWGNLRTHIRTVDITTGGNQYLFTIADTAWCINNQLESVWGISVPLNEGWERVVSKIESFYPREEVLYALNVLSLEFPVKQEEIKKAYRDMALKWHPDINPSANSKEMMQDINRAFSVLTGIDPNSLEIKERTVFDYMKKPDYEYTIGGDTVSITLNIGIPQDWIYASGYATDQKHVYLGTYAGKIVKIDENGVPQSIHDVSNTPRAIIDTGDYLYILTDTRLYILRNGEELVEVIDVMMKEKLIVGDESFGFLGKKFIRWFDESGKEIGMLKTKNPIRAVYPGLNCVNVETRQHKAVLSF